MLLRANYTSNILQTVPIYNKQKHYPDSTTSGYGWYGQLASLHQTDDEPMSATLAAQQWWPKTRQQWPAGQNNIGPPVLSMVAYLSTVCCSMTLEEFSNFKMNLLERHPALCLFNCFISITQLYIFLILSF